MCVLGPVTLGHVQEFTDLFLNLKMLDKLSLIPDKSWSYPVAFGIKKLRIQVICFGDDGEGNMFGEDELFDLFNEQFEDDIQSIDTHSFTKM